MFKFYLTNNSEIMFYDTESHLLFTSGLCLVKLKINSGTPTYCVTSILNNFLTCLGEQDGFGLSDESAQYFKNLVQSGSGYLHSLNNCFDEMKIFKEGEYHGINIADSLSTMNSFIDIAALSTIDQKFSMVEQKLNLASTNYLCSNSTPGNVTNKHLEIMSPENETYIKPNSIIAVIHMYTNTATTPCFSINNQPVPIYYEDNMVTTSNLQLAGEENKLYYYYYYKGTIGQSEEEFLLYLGKADASSNGGGAGGAATPLKTVRGDYVVIDDNISPYLYDFKLVSRKTESTETAGTLVPLEQVEAGDYTINFVTVGGSKGILTETVQANSSNSFTFPKIRCGEKWTLKGTISSDYYIAKAITAKFYDKDEILISQQNLTYPEREGNHIFANRYYYDIRDIKTPKNCAFVTFSITSRGFLSSGSSSKQYFTLTDLYWQNDYTDIELDNYNTNIKTVPFHVSHSMFGLQKEAEVRTNYWYSDDYGQLINFDSEHDNSCYTYLLGDRSWYTLSEGIFSIDLWKYNYYSYLANAPILNLSNVCSNYYLPKNSINELENKTFCIIPGNSSNNTNYCQASMMLYIKDDSFSSVEDFINFCQNNNIVVSFKIDSSNLPQQTHYNDWNEGTYSEGGREIFPEYIQDLNTPLLGSGSSLGNLNSAPHNQRYGKDIFTGKYTLVYVTGPDDSDTKPLMEITYYQNPSYTIKDIENKTDNFVNKAGDIMTGKLIVQDSVQEGYQTTASGNYSHTEGTSTIASGLASHAEGYNTVASGSDSHAEGSWTIASGEHSHTEGAFIDINSGIRLVGEGGAVTYTIGSSMAPGIKVGDFIKKDSNTQIKIINIGTDTITLEQTLSDTAIDDKMYAVRCLSVASGDYSHVEGSGTFASGQAAHAEGKQTIASGENSHAEGLGTIASNTFSHAEGRYTEATGNNSHAEGYMTLAEGTISHTEGSGTRASGDSSHAEGSGTKAIGDYSHAEGKDTSASGSWSHAENYTTTASGENSHAEGYNTIASGNRSHSEGNYTIASGVNSHAEGGLGEGVITLTGAENATTYTTYNTFFVKVGDFIQKTSSDSIYSSAAKIISLVDNTSVTLDKTLSSSAPITNKDYYVYRKSVSSGKNSHIEGAGTVASADYTHAEGWKTTASGIFSHAEGMYSEAREYCSHAEGQETVASGYDSHAEGITTIASGDYSHAEGSSYEASGDWSHAENCATTASGDCSHAEGLNTIAQRKSQHTEGEYNITDTTGSISTRGTYVHIVGNGTTNNARSNAHTLDWSGNAWFSGDVYTGSTSGINKDSGSKKLATEEYVRNLLQEFATLNNLNMPD